MKEKTIYLDRGQTNKVSVSVLAHGKKHDRTIETDGMNNEELKRAEHTLTEWAEKKLKSLGVTGTFAVEYL